MGMQKWYHQSGRQLVVSSKTKHTLTIQCSNCSPQHLPKGVEDWAHTKTHTWMSMAASFIIAQTWKQPVCPSVGEKINKLWYIHALKYYSALKNSYQTMKGYGGN